MLPKIVQILMLNTQSLPAAEKNYFKDEIHSVMQMKLGSMRVIIIIIYPLQSWSIKGQSTKPTNCHSVKHIHCKKKSLKNIGNAY